MNETRQNTSADACLSDEQFALWQVHALPLTEHESAVRHVGNCHRCRAVLGELVRTEEVRDDGRMGRYEVIEALGSGGMGLVLRAYDPLLNREVAIKVCRHGGRAIARDALLNEARTLAQVRHANVVPVYDVGIVGVEIYIAMELVEGTTLVEWMATGNRDPAARLALACDIARGLSAIHQAALVHRDLKPGNVMVRGDGSAMIVDLGLAEFHDERAGSPIAAGGTEGYVAPEVQEGGAATPRSDQYQLCLILRDTLRLCDERPQLAEMLARGSADDPSDRFASVADVLALLEAVDRAQVPRKLGRFVAAALVCAVAATLIWMTWPTSVSHKDAVVAQDTECGAKLGWSQETRSKVYDNLLRHQAAASKIQSWVDERATRAATLAREFCHAAKRGEELGFRREACVRKAWSATIPMIVAMRDGDREQTFAAIDDLASLLPLPRCESGITLAIPASLQPSVRQQGDDAMARLRQVLATDVASSADREEQLQKLRVQVAALDQPLVLARWHDELARVYAARADLGKAALEFGNAYRLATQAGADEFSASAIVMQLSMTTAGTSSDATEQLADHARSAVERVGNPFWTSQLNNALAKIALTEGRNDEAIALFKTAIAQLKVLRLQPHQMELAMSQNLGTVLLESGQADQAASFLARTLALAEIRWSLASPLYWELRAAHGTALLAAGDGAAAADEFAIVASGLRDVSARPATQGMVQSYLAAALVSLDRGAEARIAAERSVELVAMDAGESPALVWPLASAAQVLLGEGDGRGALGHLQRAEKICGKGSCREVERIVLSAYLAIALKETGATARGLGVARKVFTSLAQPGFESARRDLLSSFPALAR